MTKKELIAVVYLDPEEGENSIEKPVKASSLKWHIVEGLFNQHPAHAKELEVEPFTPGEYEMCCVSTKQEDLPGIFQDPNNPEKNDEDEVEDDDE